MNYQVCRKARIFALPLLACVAAGMFAAETQGQIFRRYSQPAYSPYQSSYAVAPQSSCTCQQQAQMAQQPMVQQTPYQQVQPAVRYAVYYNPRTNQTYLRPINTIANSQVAPAQQRQVDVARQMPTASAPSVLNSQNRNTSPSPTSPVANPATNVVQPALTQPALIEPALTSPVPTNNIVEPAATFTSQPTIQQPKARSVDVETNREAPTPAPAPANVENEKKSYSVLEPAGGQN